MDYSLYADRFYTAQDFADRLNVHRQHIYNSLDCNHTPRLPIHLPKPIKVGERGYRWTGKQIREYQIALATLSGVDISDDDTAPATAVLQPRQAGRPRNSMETGVKS